MEVIRIKKPKVLRDVIPPLSGRLSEMLTVAFGLVFADGEQIGTVVNSAFYQFHLGWKLILLTQFTSSLLQGGITSTCFTWDCL